MALSLFLRLSLVCIPPFECYMDYKQYSSVEVVNLLVRTAVHAVVMNALMQMGPMMVMENQNGGMHHQPFPQPSQHMQQQAPITSSMNRSQSSTALYINKNFY
uniref:Uncharacterized protein n=1 Tax=Heterorhabditis bacteriophora TaxID=37862 RepID=A0A1I7X261_HETBA